MVSRLYLHIATSVAPSCSSTPLANTSVVYPLSSYLSHDRLSTAYSIFLVAITSMDEPLTYFQAIKHKHWHEAMSHEIEALDKNGTWTIEPLTPGKRAIDSK